MSLLSRRKTGKFFDSGKAKPNRCGNVTLPIG